MAERTTDALQRRFDLSMGSLPIGKVLGMAAVIVGAVWWVADQSADMRALRADLVATQKSIVAAQATADAASAAAAQAGARVDRDSAVISTRLSGVEAGLVDARAALARIETYLRDRRP